MKTKDAARGRWRQILPLLGIPKKFLTGKHGPCPACGGKDRFRFTDRKMEGDYFCNHCGAGDGLRLVMKVHGWAYRTACKRVDEAIGNNHSLTRSLPAVKPPPPPWAPSKALADATLWLRRHHPARLRDWLHRHGPDLDSWINRERPWGYYLDEVCLESAQYLRKTRKFVDWGTDNEQPFIRYLDF